MAANVLRIIKQIKERGAHVNVRDKIAAELRTAIWQACG